MASPLEKSKRESHGPDTSEPAPKRVRASSPVAGQATGDGNPYGRESCESYVNKVTALFKDTDPETYQRYVDFMRNLRQKGMEGIQLDHAGSARFIKELFQDHTSLILGFNIFLPEEHKITLPSSPPDPAAPTEVVMRQQGVVFKLKVKAMKQQGMVFKRKVKALGKTKYQEFSEILGLYKKQENSIDHVYKLAETLFAEDVDILAEFRKFLPSLEVSSSDMLNQELPDKQPAVAPRKVRFMLTSGRTCRRAVIAGKGKGKLKAMKSKDGVGKLKGKTTGKKEQGRKAPTKSKQVQPHPPRKPTRTATTRSPKAQTQPRNRVKESCVAVQSPPPPPLPSAAELMGRLHLISKCRPDCKACEHVEYLVFDWHAEDPEYYAKGMANRERERQALIAQGVPGSFNDDS